MERAVCTWVVIASMLAVCYCNDEIDVVHKKMKRLNKKLNSFKKELIEMDTNMHESIDIAKESIHLKLTQLIKQEVKEAMAEFRGGESAVGSRHDETIRILQQGHQHTKRQLNRVEKTLRDVQQENKMIKAALEKAETSMAESCAKCGTDTKLLESDLKQGNWNDERTKLEKSNSTRKSEKEQSSSTPTSTTTITPPTTSIAVQPPPVRNRLIIAPWRSSELSQLNLHDNSLRQYSLTVPAGVSALCYVQRLGRLLVGTYYPERITSTTLDGEDTQTLREGVGATGMAVDEGRQLVFMTTWLPKLSISRMSTRGGNFIAIRVLSDEYRFLHGIAVNTRDRELYVCSGTGVYRLSYNGDVLQTVSSTSSYSLTFDSVGHILYISEGRSLRKMSEEGVSDVTTLSVTPYTLSYYNNTVFYGGGYDTRYVGAVELGEKPRNIKLQTHNLDNSRELIICLVP